MTGIAINGLNGWFKKLFRYCKGGILIDYMHINLGTIDNNSMD